MRWIYWEKLEVVRRENEGKKGLALYRVNSTRNAMSDKTSIQWADSTVNPIMGCGGCELFPPPAEIFLKINAAVRETGHSVNSREIYEELVTGAYGCINQPLEGHKNAVNTTNIWHLRHRFLMRLGDKTKDDFAAHAAAEKAIEQSITCYAAVQHLNKGQSLDKEEYKGHPGYAPIFESVTQFPGRAADTAKLKDLLGCCEGRATWKAGLPRLVFVSDMGDALSGFSQFPFLKQDLVPAIISEEGKRHLWLWLTKRPLRLAEFAEQIGGLPENVCAMTTLTSSDSENLKRLADLKKVQAHMRGLSIEPLWERIDPKKLDLRGIDWVIVGGESGSGLNYTRPFALEWAEELRDHCRKKRVAFFLKQLGRNPTRNGEVFKLRDKHGGNWDEWPDEVLKVREFPKAFHQYRKNEMKHPAKSRSKETKKMKIQLPPPTDEEKADFERLDMVVKNGLKGFIEVGAALMKIRDQKLWRAGNFKNWEDYCQNVEDFSRTHAHRLIEASRCVTEMQNLSNFAIKPKSESQVRPLFKLKNIEDRWHVWNAIVMMIEDEMISPKITAKTVREMVAALLENEMYDAGIELPSKDPSTLVEKKQDVMSKLRTAVGEKKSWEDVEKLIKELEKLI